MLQIGRLSLCAGLAACTIGASAQPQSFSGIYPHLAMYNSKNECGVGAVVRWADRTWVITYAPHFPGGSDDGLYEIDDALNVVRRPESIGGTPANRMIHTESGQLNIGPYFIDDTRNVRTIPYSTMRGRHTGTARHLFDPANTLYIATMEEGLYEVDVHTLAVTELFANTDPDAPWLPGDHGKGLYTAQGRVYYSNNGEANQSGDPIAPTGVLGSYIGFGNNWSVVDRRQHVEITGPGHIYGNPPGDDRLWSTGWDHKSVVLMLLDGEGWKTYRLPKGSYTYDPRHGWYTEWPRIRPADGDRWLMNMHGLFWDFPETFSDEDTAGLRPLSTYLKILSDWEMHPDGRIMFGTNDGSRLDGVLAGQSNCNLWFVEPDQMTEFGPREGWGGPWINDQVSAGTPSEPYQFAGFDHRVLHITHDQASPVSFELETDAGNGIWTTLGTVTVPASGYAFEIIDPAAAGEWIRVTASADCEATAYFHYGDAEPRSVEADPMFDSLVRVDSGDPFTAGIVRTRGGDLGHTMQGSLSIASAADGASERVYHEIEADMSLDTIEDETSQAWMESNAGITGPGFSTDPASVVITDGSDRYRVPRGHAAYDEPTPGGWPRGVRPIVTERDQFNCHGTFYELPKNSAGKYERMRPVGTHNMMITDYASWRGMLVLTGVRAGTATGGHVVSAGGGDEALWFGAIDDLWKLGKPRGYGGPWLDTEVVPGQPSDQYLMTGYDQKRVELWHDAESAVEVTIQVQFDYHSGWQDYATLSVEPDERLEHVFPEGYSAHWVRTVCDTACTASAQFYYDWEEEHTLLEMDQFEGPVGSVDGRLDGVGGPWEVSAGSLEVAGGPSIAIGPFSSGGSFAESAGTTATRTLDGTAETSETDTTYVGLFVDRDAASELTVELVDGSGTPGMTLGLRSNNEIIAGVDQAEITVIEPETDSLQYPFPVGAPASSGTRIRHDAGSSGEVSLDVTLPLNIPANDPGNGSATRYLFLLAKRDAAGSMVFGYRESAGQRRKRMLITMAGTLSAIIWDENQRDTSQAGFVPTDEPFGLLVRWDSGVNGANDRARVALYRDGDPIPASAGSIAWDLDTSKNTNLTQGDLFFNITSGRVEIDEVRYGRSLAEVLGGSAPVFTDGFDYPAGPIADGGWFLASGANAPEVVASGEARSFSDGPLFLLGKLTARARQGFGNDEVRVRVFDGGSVPPSAESGVGSWDAIARGDSSIGLGRLRLAVSGGSAGIDDIRVGETYRSVVDRLIDQGPTGCGVADVAEPFGVLNIDDVLAFLNAFASSDPIADVAAPSGVFDIDDVLVFLSGFAAGCP